MPSVSSVFKSFFHQRDSRFVLFGLGVDETSWRGVGLLGAVFFGSLGIAAVLTPPAYWLVQLWHDRTGSANAQWLLDKGVDVYFDRLRMATIVLGLPWLMSKCHLWSWRAIGLAPDNRNFFRGALALFTGVFLILGLAMWKRADVVGYDEIFASDNFTAILKVSLNAILGGLIIGIVEETVFRGMILRIFYTATRRPWVALAVMAAFFAYTHFKVPTAVWAHVAPGVHWDTGWFVAFWTTCGISENFDAVQFLVLWLLGMVLGVLTLRTGSLLPAIGLHTGLVSALFFFRGQGLTEGWQAAVVLGVILAGVMRIKNYELRIKK